LGPPYNDDIIKKAGRTKRLAAKSEGKFGDRDIHIPHYLDGEASMDHPINAKIE
jgi:hypothetical protein